MEKILRFAPEAARQVVVRLASGQVEMYADDIDRVVVLVAGDERSVSDLRVMERDGTLSIDQPNYGLSLNTLTDGKWLQVCVRVPNAFRGVTRLNTVSGRVGVRSFNATEMTLDTVSGDISARNVACDQASFRTISGDLSVSGITAERISARTVGGDITLAGVASSELKANTVTGRIEVDCARAFDRMDLSTVSGNALVTAPCVQMDVTLRSVSGQVRTERVSIEEGAKAALRMTSVSGDLRLSRSEQ